MPSPSSALFDEVVAPTVQQPVWLWVGVGAVFVVVIAVILGARLSRRALRTAPARGTVDVGKPAPSPARSGHWPVADVAAELARAFAAEPDAEALVTADDAAIQVRFAIAHSRTDSQSCLLVVVGDGRFEHADRLQSRDTTTTASGRIRTWSGPGGSAGIGSGTPPRFNRGSFAGQEAARVHAIIDGVLALAGWTRD